MKVLLIPCNPLHIVLQRILTKEKLTNCFESSICNVKLLLNDLCIHFVYCMRSIAAI